MLSAANRVTGFLVDRLRLAGNRFLWPTLLLMGLISIVGVMFWQAVVASGAPDPTAAGLNRAATVLTAGVLVFREGLEAILVLAAITAGMARGSQQAQARAISSGAAAAFAATIATWFIVVAAISEVNAPALHVQAATGLLAILVLLIVMNWFFHKVYWTGWIAHHYNRKRRILEVAQVSGTRAFCGLVLLGFTAVYREGFEIVLFLQNLRLRAGEVTIMKGVGIGLGLTAIVAILTFMGYRRLPYKRLLVCTGILLGVVLLVMVGESVQELQLAGWLGTTPLSLSIPAWLGTWFSLFPNLEGLLAQALAGSLVLGSYFAARRITLRSRLPRSRAANLGVEIEQDTVV